MLQASEEDNEVTAIMRWDSGDTDNTHVVLAGMARSAVYSFNKYSGIEASSAWLRLGNKMLHRPCKIEVTSKDMSEAITKGDIFPIGTFGIFCSTKMLRYSALDVAGPNTKTELKHAKSQLNFGSSAVIFSAGWDAESDGDSGRTWAHALCKLPRIFDIFANPSSSGTPKEIFLCLGSALVPDLSQKDPKKIVNMNATQFMGLRLGVKKNGGFGEPYVAMLSGGGDGTIYDAAKEDLPVKLFTLENKVLVQSIDSMHVLEETLGPACIAKLAIVLQQWRPLHDLVELSPWQTHDGFLEYMFSLRTRERDDDLGDMGMFFFKQALNSLVTELTTNEKLGVKSFSKQQQGFAIASYGSSADSLIKISDVLPSLFHAEDVGTGKTREMREVSKQMMPTLDQLPTAHRLQDQMGGGGEDINPRAGDGKGKEDGKGGGKDGKGKSGAKGKGGKGKGANAAGTSGGNAGEESGKGKGAGGAGGSGGSGGNAGEESGKDRGNDKRDRGGPSGNTPDPKKLDRGGPSGAHPGNPIGLDSSTHIRSITSALAIAGGQSNLTPLAQQQAISLELQTLRKRVVELEGELGTATGSLTETQRLLSAEQATVASMRAQVADYFRISTYAAQESSRADGLQAQLFEVKKEKSFLQSVTLATLKDVSVDRFSAFQQGQPVVPPPGPVYQQQQQPWQQQPIPQHQQPPYQQHPPYQQQQQPYQQQQPQSYQQPLPQYQPPPPPQYQPPPYQLPYQQPQQQQQQQQQPYQQPPYQQPPYQQPYQQPPYQQPPYQQPAPPQYQQPPPGLQ